MEKIIFLSKNNIYTFVYFLNLYIYIRNNINTSFKLICENNIIY